MNDGEKGQALVIVLALVAFGGLVISPFLSQAGNSLLGSRMYGESIGQQYSSDAGVEHAIWDLRYGDLAGQIPDPADSFNYQLDETINGVTPDITVTNTDNSTYQIVSVAENETIQATIQIVGGIVTIMQWQMNQ